MHLGLEEDLYAYTIKRHNLRKYYFVVNFKLLQLVTYFPDIRKNKPQGNILLFGAWGLCEGPHAPRFSGKHRS